MLGKERFMVVFGHKMHFREIEQFPGRERFPGYGSERRHGGYLTEGYMSTCVDEADVVQKQRRHPPYSAKQDAAECLRAAIKLAVHKTVGSTPHR